MLARPVSDSLALHGGAPIRPREKTWPAWPLHGAEEREAVLAVLESGNWWYGEQVRHFEAAYAEFQGARYCVTANSGTTAQEVLLQAVGIGPGDEVIVPPYTFVATATAVMRLGATPVFADVGADWNLDPAAAEAAITPRTKALYPVHFGGVIADMPALQALADKHGLLVVEDAAHAWGSAWEGRGAGTLSRGGTVSFQHSKNITAGEGGAIVTDDEALAERCRSITNSGRVFIGGGPNFVFGPLGTNVRLTEIQAAILRAQLGRLPAQTATREANAAMLDKALAEIPGITPQPADPRMTRRAVHLYCFRLDAERFGCSRDALMRAAQAEGLPLRPGYPMPCYRHPLFQEHAGYDYRSAHCPNAEDLCAHSAVWIAHPLLLGSAADMTDIVAILEKIQRHAAELA